MKRILLSAAGSAAAISFISFFRSKGFYVLGIDVSVDSKPLSGEFCDEFYIAPMATDIDDYLEFIRTMVSKFDVFIPFIDEEILALNQLDENADKELIEKLMVSPRQTNEICINKIEFQSYCEEGGVPVAPRASSVPCVYKPNIGRGGKGVQIIKEEPIFDFYKTQEGVVQKLMEGTEFTVDALFNFEGSLQYLVPRERVQTSGVSRIGKIVYDETILQFCERVVNQFEFRFAVNIQVIKDEAGHCSLIEINPRLAGSSIFCDIAGIPFLEDTVNSFLKVDFTPDLSARMNALKTISGHSIIRYWTEYAVT